MSRESAVGWSLFLFKVFCATVIFFATAFTIFTIGPVAETRYFPAVSKLTISNLGRSAEGHAVIYAEFTKLRACEYLGVAWYRGKPEGSFERVPVVLMRREGDRSSPNRPTGRQRAGPWVVHMPVEEIAGNSFARLTHRCHPFWNTLTDFWP